MPDQSDPDKSKKGSKTNNYNLDRFLNSPAGTDPYNTIDVPRGLILEEKSQKRRKVQDLCDKAKRAGPSKDQAK